MCRRRGLQQLWELISELIHGMKILYTHTYMHTYKLIKFIHPQMTSGSLNLEDNISLIIQWKEKFNFILDKYMYFQAVNWVHNSSPFSMYFITTVPNREQ